MEKDLLAGRHGPRNQFRHEKYCPKLHSLKVGNPTYRANERLRCLLFQHRQCPTIDDDILGRRQKIDDENHHRQHFEIWRTDFG